MIRKISKTCSNKAWGGGRTIPCFQSHNNNNNMCMIVCVTIFWTYWGVWIRLDVAFFHWEEEDASAAVDDVADSVIV